MVDKVNKTEEDLLSDEIGELVNLQPTEETPPVEDTPPEETPPAEVPPEETPPEETPPAEVPPSETPPAEVPPEEKPPEEKPPEAVPPAKPSVEDVPPSETPPAAEAEWTPPTREEYTNLLTTMNDLAGKVGLALPVQTPPPVAPVKKPPEETPAAPVVVPAEVKPLEPIEFVADEDTLYQISRDPKKFNELMNKVMLETHNRAVQLTTQNVLTSIPQIVGKSIQQATTIQRTADDFYKANEDLVPFKPFVMMVTNEVAAANPDKALGDILEEVATTSRKKLNLKERAVAAVVKEDEQSPAFVKAQGTRKTPVAKTVGLQGEIDDMLK